MKAKSYISGARWSGLKQALYTGAGLFNLDLKIIDHDKGLIRETIYFEVSGRDILVKGFMKKLDKAITEHNA